ncbi:hypothetical protein [Bifidobacterium pullorum]|uniref:hypothetical protein n=1 Tax=Bifidobacterium pullorum TaxID=78448 RepID=UPI00320B9AF7
MSKSRGRSVRLHGMGFLPVLSLSMRSLPDGDTGKTFSFTSVLWRVMLVGMLSVVNLAAQTWWTVSSRSVSYDPWWAGLLGWSSYDFNAGGIIAGVFAVSVAPGLLLFFAGLLFSWIRWIFLASMILMIGGVSRMLGTGLGKTILYVQVRDGSISADSVRSGTNYVDLSSSAVVADSWPVVAAAAVFAVAALAFALLSRSRNDNDNEVRPSSRVLIGGKIAIVVGLLGIAMVECGFMPITLILLLVAVFVAFLWLPGEVRAARTCERRKVGAEWQWHAASLIWLETLAIFLVAVFGILGL